ncbi:hypothetical protein IE4872_PB00138 (plasmid) [Rhizobium gallicum]|uniref:Uncharacterized protein n=2 Tax=Rhizobium gallicum TaxID=56730 RepID=A0A0B4XAG5_9HYPH|nr:hypothetical protein RGR602_PA00172 [Rhizobium gallicum bv. gallicum R602sp]APO70009.1 hypothetical protein IE4872_PB00138 [Rhizobium gallicum]
MGRGFRWPIFLSPILPQSTSRRAQADAFCTGASAAEMKASKEGKKAEGGEPVAEQSAGCR